MRASILSIFTAFTLLAACDGSSSTSSTSTDTGGGGAGGTPSDGGGGTGTGGSTTSDGGGGGSTASTTTMPADLCETAGAAPVFFANEIQPIFGQRCGNATSCHLGSQPPEGLSLKPADAYADLVDVDAVQTCNGQKRVAPGDASGSYLVNKITATDLCPTTKKMPPSSTMPQADKQKIIDWICQGAQNN